MEMCKEFHQMTNAVPKVEQTKINCVTDDRYLVSCYLRGTGGSDDNHWLVDIIVGNKLSIHAVTG